MTPEPSRPIRARNAEEKQQRRTEILRAAERLWQTAPYSELSMNQVAREAKLAKGTLYLYYDTKEELFLALLSEHLQAWFSELIRRLRSEPVRSADQLTDVMLASLREHMSLRRLILLLSTVLERKINPESALEFRRLVRRNLHEISSLLDLEPEQAFLLLCHAYALVLGWHQTGEASSIVYSAGEQATLPYRRPEFESQLDVALRAVMRSVFPQVREGVGS